MFDDPAAAKRRSARAWQEVRALARQHRGYLIGGLALTLVGRLSGLILPASTKFFIDRVLVEGRRDLLVPLALAVLAGTLVQAITGYALSRMLGAVAQRAVADMRRRLARHVLRLHVAYFDATQSGALVSRVMNDPDGIRNLLGSGFVQLMGALVTATASLGVLFWIEWRMTAVMLLFLGGIGAGVAYAFRTLRPINRERSLVFARVTARLTEAFGGIRILKAYVAERREDQLFTRGAHEMLRLVVRSLSGWAAAGALTNFAVGAIGATLILMGGQAVLGGSLTLGDLAMYALFTGLVAAPLIQVAQVGTQLSDAMAGLERARELLDEPTEDSPSGDTRDVPPLRGDVRVEGVHFEYRPGVPVLVDVSFEGAAGTTTALVGASGSGKSTLLGLLAAFHRPTSGSIHVDGHDLATFDLRQYRSRIGLVLQETILFDGTILENISFSRPGASQAEIERVAVVAQCDEFIRRMPDGWETIVGERGIRLSGGQRQRVAIARALLADPSILLLDEATSSLDSESEALIQQGLEALRRGRTTFVIAHRLSTILSADRILVMDGGRVVERGTHADLLARGGKYARLYEQQQRTESNRFINPGEELAST